MIDPYLSVSQVPVRGDAVSCPQQRISPTGHRRETFAFRYSLISRRECD